MDTKTGNFNPQRTLSGLFFVIPERLASVRAVALAFYEQTNKHSQLYNIDMHDNNFICDGGLVNISGDSWITKFSKLFVLFLWVLLM